MSEQEMSMYQNASEAKEGAQSMSTMPEHMDSHESDVAVIQETWEQIQRDPAAHLVQHEVTSPEGEKTGKIVFVAGGELLSRMFGDHTATYEPGSRGEQLRQAVAQHFSENNGAIEVAGLRFTENQMALLGSFYFYLHEKGNVFHCIDERLGDDQEAAACQSHEGCGACAGVAKAMGLEGDALLGLINTNPARELQGLREGMEHEHASMSILVDFLGADVIKEEDRSRLQELNALPFNVSLMLDEVVAFTKEKGLTPEQRDTLLDALILWNPGLARAIIGGGHNMLADVANETIVVVDRRGVAADPEVEALAKQVENRLAELIDYSGMLMID